MPTFIRAILCALLCLVAGGVGLDKAVDLGAGVLRWEDTIFFGSFNSFLQDLVFANGTLYAVGVGPLRHSPTTHADVTVKAYDPGSGEALWTHPRPNVFEDEGAAGIAAAGGSVVLAGSSHPLLEGFRRFIFVRAMDAKTGEFLWEDQCGSAFDTQARAIVSQGNRVFVGGVCDGSGFLRAYDPQSGAVLWENSDDVVAHMAADGGQIYTVGRDSEPESTFLRSLDADTGAVNWRRAVTMMSDVLNPGGIAAHEGLVSVALVGPFDASNRIQTHDAATGAGLWGDFPGEPMGVLTLHGGLLFAGSVRSPFSEPGIQVRAYDATTGQVVWQRPGPGPVGAIEVQGSTLMVSDAGVGFHVQALDASSGLLLWEDFLSAPAGAGAGPVAVHGSDVFVGGFRGNLEIPFGRELYLLRAYDSR
ncbi:MAG: PQQ-binding-like beta-propeller repeat protein [Candidatus Polarisedimenticolia bacterium]